MSKGFRRIAGFAAMIAIPFVAPIIAPALAALPIVGGLLGGTALGTGVVGSVLGAGAGALSGQGPLQGALFGGLGGVAGGLGAGQSLFGAATPTAGLATGATGTAGALGSQPTAVIGGLGGQAVPTFGAAAPAATAGLNLPGMGGLASNPLASALSKGAAALGQTAKGMSVSGIANLAMTIMNKPPAGLTQAEQLALADAVNQANTNKQLFDQQISTATQMINSGMPNPEQAYSDQAAGVQRAGREYERAAVSRGIIGEAGLAAQRRATNIQAAREGNLAVNRDAVAAAERRRLGLAALPSAAPAGVGTVLGAFAAGPERRQAAWRQDTARAVGGLFGRPSDVNLFGNIYG